EFLGAALGLNLLFGVPLLPAGVITGVIALGMLELQRHGFRRFELAITAFLGLVLFGFLYETLKIGPSADGAAHGLIPHLDGAHAGFSHLVGGTAALMFAVALLASGISSSSVGTYAGQIVMAGFVNLRISLFARRALTMLPALVILAVGVSTTNALVFSQVVLSFGIPFARVP